MPNNNNTLFCFRCYHDWKKRKKENPKTCPHCRSPYWNKPRKKVSHLFVLDMKKFVINIHNAIIKIGGGEYGIRDEGGIHNSTHKLLNHLNKNQRNPISMGTFALNEFAKRHYFVDGNKRTAYAVAKIFMLINKCHLKIQYKEAADFIREVAKYESKITFEDIKNWFSKNCMIIDKKDVEEYLNQKFVDVSLGGEE